MWVFPVEFLPAFTHTLPEERIKLCPLDEGAFASLIELSRKNPHLFVHVTIVGERFTQVGVGYTLVFEAVAGSP